MNGLVMVIPTHGMRYLTRPSLSRPSVPQLTALVRPWHASRSLHASIPRCRTQSASLSPGDDKIHDIRNIGIIAHVDAGKTTTTELLLYRCGLTRHFGRVDHGDTVTDFLELERERGITIQSAAISFTWPLPETLDRGERPKTINLIDTPGHQDFRFEVDRCLPILDGAVCILDAVKGVETHTERVWSSAQGYKIPRIVFVNKLDRDGASFKRSVLDVASKLGAWPLICQIPWWDGDNLTGIIDVVHMNSMRWSGAGMKRSPLVKNDSAIWQQAVKARAALIESLCDRDEELMEAFVEHEQDVPASLIKQSIRKLIADGTGAVVPVLAGASLRGMGAEPLLDAIADYLPSPFDRPDLEIAVGAEKHALADVLKNNGPPKRPGHSASNKPAISGLGVAFKVVNDPHRGMLTFVRVYHGALQKNSPMWNSRRHVFEKSFNMLHIAGAKTQDIPHISVGSIGAVTGLKEARTGDTLVSFTNNKGPEALKSIHIRPPEIPDAVAFIAIYPSTVSSSKHLAASLDNASREDPSLRWTHDDKLDRYILSGLGTLHLEICQDRLVHFYKVDAEFGKIEVDYKECLTNGTPPFRYEYDGVVAGKAGKAACTATLEPLGENQADAATNDALQRDGNVIRVIFPSATDHPHPSGFDADTVRQQLLNGAVAALARGPQRGSPVHGCLVTLTFDPATDFFQPSTGAHTVGAATQAVRRALKDAQAANCMAILEPFMKVQILVPEDVGGAVEHDLSSARGGIILEVNDVSTPAASSGEAAVDLSKVYVPPDPYESVQSLRDPKKGGTRMLEIVARVPLREVLEYDGHLRSLTSGKHSLHMELDTFEPSRKAVE